MKQDDKDLLLKDLCARLPYGVKCIVTKSRTEEGQKGDVGKIVDICLEGVECIDTSPFFSEFGNFKPYLFPLSSINTELICKLNNLLPEYCRLTKNQIIGVSGDDYREIKLEQLDNLFKFFNLFHVDFRNLIEKGLAMDATGKNIY